MQTVPELQRKLAGNEKNEAQTFFKISSEKEEIGNVLKDFLKVLFIFFRERVREGKRGRETSTSCELPLACSQPETWPATEASALPGIQPATFQFAGPAFNPLSHISQGEFFFFLI